MEDIGRGHFVTLHRINHGFLTQDIIMTFHDVIIEFWRPTYACNASTESFFKDLEEGDEEESERD
jgi:hypothetical protein